MIPYVYYPILAQFGPFTIHTFGFIAAIAFIVATLLAIKFGKEKGFSIEHIFNISLISLASGVVGARFLYVIEMWDLYKFNLLDVIKVWEGGLSWLGGFIFAIVASYIYIKKNKLDFLKLLDIFTIPTAVGLLIGRIACYLSDGGHIGKITTSTLFGSMVNGELRHLTVIYSFIKLILIIAILLLLRKKEYYDGFLFMMFLMLYSIGRFFIDFFREDPTFFGLTATQIINIALAIISITYLLKHSERIKKLLKLQK